MKKIIVLLFSLFVLLGICTGCALTNKQGLKTGKTYYFQLATLYTEDMDQVGIYNCVAEGLDKSYIKVDIDSKKAEYCLKQNGTTWLSYIGEIIEVNKGDNTTTCTIKFAELDGYFSVIFDDGDIHSFMAQNGDLGLAVFSISENAMFENTKKSDQPKIEIADIDGKITIKYPKLKNVEETEIFNTIDNSVGEIFASFNPSVSYVDETNTILIELESTADLRVAVASNKDAVMSMWEAICEQLDSICEKYYIAVKTIGYNSIRVNICLSNASDKTDILYSTVNGKEKVDFTDNIIAYKPQEQIDSTQSIVLHDKPSSSDEVFTNKYGTNITKCHHSDCNNYIASSGDTWDCIYHANKCLNCGKYIDCDAIYCMDCLESSVSEKNSSGSFTNKYGTKTTQCHHSDCNNYIASSGDTWDCIYHANKCLNCGKYIDCDAMYCMDCLSKSSGN